MMTLRRLNFETLLYILALILALALRLVHLGATPLSDAEASGALGALQVAHPNPQTDNPDFDLQPAYVFLTGPIFALFGTSNFLARLWPALAGSLLVFAPFLFRRELGPKAALILAFGLALDPGLAVASRLIGGPGLALTFGLLALGFWNSYGTEQRRKPILVGILGGLALLSGPALLPGLLSLLVTWAIFRVAGRKSPTVFSTPVLQLLATETVVDDGGQSGSVATATASEALIALAAAAATVLLGSTLFLRYPQGLSAWAASFTTYLAGWGAPSGVPAARLVAALLFYQPFALIFAILGLVRWLIKLGQGNDVLYRHGVLYRQWCSLPSLIIWGLLNLILVLFYPARQGVDLIWVLAPLWVLAAIELEHYLPQGKFSPVSLVQAGILLTLAGLLWNTLVSTTVLYTVNTPDVVNSGVNLGIIRLGMLLGILGLMALTTILITLGWTWEIGRNGLIGGLGAAFLMYTFAVLWSATQLHANAPQELWAPPPATDQADLFIQTLQDLSKWHTGFSDEVDVASTVDAPSMRWILRDFRNTRFIPAVPSGEMPSILITPQSQEAPALTAAYRGQDFVWWVSPGWSGALPPDFVNWLAFRDAPLQQAQIILWARSDLFPGGTAP